MPMSKCASSVSSVRFACAAVPAAETERCVSLLHGLLEGSAFTRLRAAFGVVLVQYPQQMLSHCTVVCKKPSRESVHRT
jgi:hypothetical protein